MSILRIFTIGLFLFGSGWAVSDAQFRDDLTVLDYDLYLPDVSNRESDWEELTRVRTLLEEVNPQLAVLAANGDDFELIRELMSTIYWQIPQAVSPADTPWYDFDHFVLDSLGRQRGHICGGLSMNFIIAVSAYGYQHRAVGLFSALENYDSHVSVEVYLNNEWIVFDPTFNVNFIDGSGDFLSWHDVRADCENGTDPTHVYAAGGPRPGDDIDDYYAPICALVEYMIFSRSLESPPIFLPTSWNGEVSRSGKDLNTLTSYTFNRIYTLASSRAPFQPSTPGN